MALVSKGYCADSFTANELNKDWHLFFQNLALILDNQQKILQTDSYFFSQPCFAMCSWPYLKGDGALPLGYLLLGWWSGSLIEICSSCPSRRVLVTSFAGSVLTGRNSWTGICHLCRQRQRGEHSSTFRQWVDFILELRQAFPATVERVEEYPGQEFTWGGKGLKPATKKRIVQVLAANPVTLEVLINELKSGQTRPRRPPNLALLQKSLMLKSLERR